MFVTIRVAAFVIGQRLPAGVFAVLTVVGKHPAMVYADIRKVPSDWQSIELFTRPGIDIRVLKRQVEPGVSAG